jgi:amino acid adenylation domain-containing protein
MIDGVPLLQGYLIESARRLPQKTALVCGRERITYGELERRSNALANALADVGVKRGDRVIVFAGNTVETVVSFWAVLKANAIVSIINPLLKAGKLAYCLNDLRATAMITDAALAEGFLPAAAGAPHLRATFVGGALDPQRGGLLPRHISLADAIGSANSVRPPARGCLDIDLAAIVYTSGSTGDPKGVMLSHRNMLTAATSIAAYLGNVEDDVFLNALPLAFDYGLYQMIMAFAAGARLILEPSFGVVQQVVARMSKERVTALPLLPTVCALLAELRTLQEFDLTSVRYVTVSGAALSAKHIEFLKGAFPRARIFSMFGLTECKRCAYLPPEDLDRKPTSVGIAIPNTELWLVDDENRKVRPHQVGQLVIRGATVMQGYWDDPALTAERLRPGVLPGERLLYTGDLCTQDEDGYLYFIGRSDEVIKSRGEKVAPREVEMALTRIPGIKEAAVIGVPDPMLGQAIKAFVVLESNVVLSISEIVAVCQRSLAPASVPKHVQFLPSLPKGVTGKIDKTALS